MRQLLAHSLLIHHSQPDRWGWRFDPDRPIYRVWTNLRGWKVHAALVAWTALLLLAAFACRESSPSARGNTSFAVHVVSMLLCWLFMSEGLVAYVDQLTSHARQVLPIALRKRRAGWWHVFLLWRDLGETLHKCNGALYHSVRVRLHWQRTSSRSCSPRLRRNSIMRCARTQVSSRGAWVGFGGDVAQQAPCAHGAGSRFVVQWVCSNPHAQE
jgi:hypothetical protein